MSFHPTPDRSIMPVMTNSAIFLGQRLLHDVYNCKNTGGWSSILLYLMDLYSYIPYRRFAGGVAGWNTRRLICTTFDHYFHWRFACLCPKVSFIGFKTYKDNLSVSVASCSLSGRLNNGSPMVLTSSLVKGFRRISSVECNWEVSQGANLRPKCFE